MVFVATTVKIGSKGMPLEVSGTLKTCRTLNFEEQLGKEVNGTLRGIV